MTRPKRVPAPVADHPHHWRIATPDGREKLPGICRHCGAAKEFPAAEPIWGTKEHGNKPIITTQMRRTWRP